MVIKSIFAKLFAILIVSFYAGAASAAFTGGVTIVVSGSTTVENNLNSGVDFVEGFGTIILSDLAPGVSRLASSTGGVVDFGIFGDFGFGSNPFVDFDIAASAGTTLMSTGLPGSTVELTLSEVVAVLPVSGEINGAVDYAGLGNLTINGSESTEVFWQYNVSGGSVGINIDTAGQSSADFIAIVGQAAAVPVPAAVWLFGSALVGLAGVSRKQKN